MELFPFGKRASKQLREISGGQRHIRRASRLLRPDPDIKNDGRSGRGGESKEKAKSSG